MTLIFATNNQNKIAEISRITSGISMADLDIISLKAAGIDQEIPEPFNTLEENAFAGIKANLSYKGNDGTERDFEFITTRYTVIFTGEKLPNEKRADAVYIELHPRYHEMLKHSKTRPLDYKYLRELAPAPQRFYELLSFAMFGTLMHGRPNAQMLYSEFCRSAPLTRYTERTKTTKQMYKIHKPHIDAGYIKSVEFLETIDENGVIDWLMKYIPGRRARHEFRAFSNKRLTEQQSRKPRLVKPQEKKDKAPSVALQHKHQENPLLEKLMSFGIGESRAVKLINSDSAECELWVGAWSFQNQKGMDNPAAVLIKFIETKHRPFPKAYKDSKARESRQREQEEQVTRQQAEDFYFDFYSESFRAFQRIEFQAIRENNLEAFTVFEKWLDKNHGRGLRILRKLLALRRKRQPNLQRGSALWLATCPRLLLLRS